MSILNNFECLSIALTNGWWFSLIFISINGFMIAIYPEHFKLRVLKQPEFENKYQRVCTIISFLLFQFSIWYSIFIPVIFDTISFYSGLLLYITGLICYITAMVNYASTSPDQPVTKGIYRFSRNPQQIMSILIWVGVGLMLQSYLIVICSLLQIPFSYPGFIAQEKTCIKKYGQPYIKYLKESRRYL